MEKYALHSFYQLQLRNVYSQKLNETGMIRMNFTEWIYPLFSIKRRVTIKRRLRLNAGSKPLLFT